MSQIFVLYAFSCNYYLKIFSILFQASWGVLQYYKHYISDKIMDIVVKEIIIIMSNQVLAKENR